MLFVARAVKKIAHYQYGLRFKILYLRQQPLKVFFKDRLRYPNTTLPEVPCFAKVQVRQDEYLFLFPENATPCR